MAEEESQEGTQIEQAEPEKKESLKDILKETILEQPKETDKKTEPTTQDEQPAKGEVKAETETEKSSGLLPHENFTASQKEYFNTLNDDGKKLMLEKWGDLESGFSRKYKSLVKERQVAEEFNQLFEPHKEQLALSGMTPMQYNKMVLAGDKFIRENPIEGIKWLAKTHSVDLTSLTKSPEEQDPINEKINELNKKIETVSQEFSNRDVSVLAKQVEDFKNAKDTDGNLKYPHFDAVREEMAKLNAATGETDLLKLYNKSIRLNDDLYQKQLDAEIAKRQASLQKQSDVAKAKKSNTSLKNSVNANVSSKDYESIDDIMRDTIKE